MRSALDPSHLSEILHDVGEASSAKRRRGGCSTLGTCDVDFRSGEVNCDPGVDLIFNGVVQTVFVAVESDREHPSTHGSKYKEEDFSREPRRNEAGQKNPRELLLRLLL